VVHDYRVFDSRFADSVAALATPSRTRQLERDIRGLAHYLEHAGDEELSAS
jgi:hypothetical protein